MAVVDASRKQISRKLYSNSQTEQMVTFLKSFGSIRLTVEASVSDEWFIELVRPIAERVILAHRLHPYSGVDKLGMGPGDRIRYTSGLVQ